MSSTTIKPKVQYPDMTHMTTRQSFTPPSLPPTSLIICSRNRPALLRKTVESVLQGDEVPTELIIVKRKPTRRR